MKGFGFLRGTFSVRASAINAKRRSGEPDGSAIGESERDRRKRARLIRCQLGVVFLFVLVLVGNSYWRVRVRKIQFVASWLSNWLEARYSNSAACLRAHLIGSDVLLAVSLGLFVCAALSSE